MNDHAKIGMAVIGFCVAFAFGVALATVALLRSGPPTVPPAATVTIDTQLAPEPPEFWVCLERQFAFGGTYRHQLRYGALYLFRDAGTNASAMVYVPTDHDEPEAPK